MLAVLRWGALVLLMLQCMLQLNLAFSSSASPPKRAPAPVVNKRVSAKSSWADIETEINNYLDYKRALSLAGSALSPSDMDDIGSYDNPLAMFIPSGWYKDNDAIDLRKRSDKRLPTEFHPLSYLELRACGFEHLIDIIIEFGGPMVVGEKIGILFVEPKRVYKEDESLRPVRTESFALDMRGSLQLGQSLDDKLEAAAQLDLGKIKANMAAKQRNVLRPEEIEKLLDDLRGGEGK